MISGVTSSIIENALPKLARHQVPGKLLVVLERIMKAHTTDSEKTDIQVFSVYISIASVKEHRVLFSAQLRSRSASAA